MQIKLSQKDEITLLYRYILNLKSLTLILRGSGLLQVTSYHNRSLSGISLRLARL